MKIVLQHLLIRTRRTTEYLDFSEGVTFLHGPVGTGKSTVARLIDYCLGGDLERTPALQQEFIAVELSLVLGGFHCVIERAADENRSVRITWTSPTNEAESVNAPINAEAASLLVGAEVYNLSDLIFYLCGVTPIKVRKRRRDPESPLIRLSFRDIWWYCYLDQLHLDSSFFYLEDPFRGRKSQDAMRFFTGLHSERLSQLDEDLMKTLDEQRTKREAVQQIRTFMRRFELGSEIELREELADCERKLAAANARRAELEAERSASTHPADTLRQDLRRMGNEVDKIYLALTETEEVISEHRALRAEILTAKLKAERSDHASTLLGNVVYVRCPQCATDLSQRIENPTDHCSLCGTPWKGTSSGPPLELEVLRRDLNDRIDQLSDSIARREREQSRLKKELGRVQQRKEALDRQLQQELARYDSAFIEAMRASERETATISERMRSLQKLLQMPQAVDALEEEAGALQGRIDRLRRAFDQERDRLRGADATIAAIAEEFKRVMLSVSFPGVSPEDKVTIDPRNWRPVVVHKDQEWTFFDTGSGGKKTLFNVCYALAIHAVALKRGLPVPTVLIIDSPTKNISEDENPDLVESLYSEIYSLARGENGRQIQFLLIDSEMVPGKVETSLFLQRRMAGEADAPSLIPYYHGP